MSYRFVDWNEIELYQGTLRGIRRELGITAFGINLHEMKALADDYPEHDERETESEELYICLHGSGTITVDGDEIALGQGRCVFVTPESQRKIVAGDSGVTN